MIDFETHPRGTAEEIKLSRQLSAAIEDARLYWDWSIGIVPMAVCMASDELVEHYMKQMEREQQ